MIPAMMPTHSSLELLSSADLRSSEPECADVTWRTVAAPVITTAAPACASTWCARQRSPTRSGTGGARVNVAHSVGWVGRSVGGVGCVDAPHRLSCLLLSQSWSDLSGYLHLERCKPSHP